MVVSTQHNFNSRVMEKNPLKSECGYPYGKVIKISNTVHTIISAFRGPQQCFTWYETNSHTGDKVHVWLLRDKIKFADFKIYTFLSDQILICAFQRRANPYVFVAGVCLFFNMFQHIHFSIKPSSLKKILFACGLFCSCGLTTVT